MLHLRRRSALFLLPALLLPVIAPAAAEARSRLVIASATEPPDFLARGGVWRATITVANEGSSRSSAGSLHFYLSLGRRFSEDDLGRKLGTRPARASTFPALSRGRQTSRRLTLTVPSAVPAGAYHLVTCLGRARVGSDNVRCIFSGQVVNLGGKPSTAGPQGPAGPKGDRGDRGEAQQVFTIPRTSLDTGFTNINDGETGPHPLPADPTTDTVSREGSSQRTTLLTVGPFRFEFICREAPGFESGFGTERGRDEAKVLVYHEDPNGTMAFRTLMGSRANVTAGLGVAGREGATGGEGQHQLLATFRQRDEGFSSVEDDPATPVREDQNISGFQAGGGFIAHSNGWDVVFNGFVGIDVLGFGTPDNLQPDFPDDDEMDKAGEDDRCVAAGSVTVVNRPAA